MRGGQLEIQNSAEKYLYRGEIETAEVKDGVLSVHFKWLAKLEEDGKWLAQTDLDYEISLEITHVNDIGAGRIFYRVACIWESGTFFPSDHDTKLDPGKVAGFAVTISD